jgi:hypothetical protein
VAYKMKDTHLPQIGFIAQDVEQILPEVVVRPQDINDPTQHYTMSYGNMVAVTVKAIQELKAENDNLRAEISVLRQQKPAVQKDNQDNTPAWLWLVMGGGIVLLLAVGGVGMMVIRLRRDVRVMQKVA